MSGVTLPGVLCDVCLVRDKKVGGRIKCEDCGQNLCFACVEPHESNPILQGHILYDIRSPSISDTGRDSGYDYIVANRGLPYARTDFGSPPGPPLPERPPSKNDELLMPDAGEDDVFKSRLPHIESSSYIHMGNTIPNIYENNSQNADILHLDENTEIPQVTPSKILLNTSIYRVQILRKSPIPVQCEEKYIWDIEACKNGNIVLVRENYVQLLDKNMQLLAHLKAPEGVISKKAAKQMKRRPFATLSKAFGRKKSVAMEEEEEDTITNQPRTCLLADYNIAVSNTKREQIDIFEPDTGIIIQSIPTSSFHGRLLGLVSNHRGELVVCDGADLTVKHISQTTGQVLASTPVDLLKNPIAAAVQKTDIIIVTEYRHKAHCITAINRLGEVQFQYGEKGNGDQQVNHPSAVCTDDEDNIIIADSDNHRIHLLAADGTFIQYLLTQEDGLRHPRAVTIDSNGYLFVGTWNGEVYLVRYTADLQKDKGKKRSQSDHTSL